LGAYKESLDYAAKLGEEDIRWARREVVERCIYGVDLNPLAVELAKLSLWLYTVSKGRPLSFLEHHLRLGNSLIGAKIEDIGRLPAKAKEKRMVREALTPTLSLRERETEAEYGQQLSLFDESAFTQSAFRMVGGAQNIEKMPTDSVVQVKKKEEILATVLDANREPYRNSEILEDYPNDPRGPSCLVLGYAHQGYPIHIVCGRTPRGDLRIITVYLPSLPKWLDERTRRR
jgi:hypothetical protein